MSGGILKILEDYGLGVFLSVIAVSAIVWISKLALKNPLTVYSDLLKEVETARAALKIDLKEAEEKSHQKDELIKQIGNGDNAIRAELREELAIIRQEGKELRNKYEALLVDHANLQGKFIALENELRTKVVLFESSHQSLPIPQWLKDRDGKVLSANPAYGSMVLEPLGKTLDDYIGHTDANVYPKEIAMEYKVNDQRVWVTGETWIGHETVMTPSGPQQWQIVKYLRRNGPLKLGIGGIAIPPLKITP